MPVERPDTPGKDWREHEGLRLPPLPAMNVPLLRSQPVRVWLETNGGSPVVRYISISAPCAIDSIPPINIQAQMRADEFSSDGLDAVQRWAKRQNDVKKVVLEHAAGQYRLDVFATGPTVERMWEMQEELDNLRPLFDTNKPLITILTEAQLDRMSSPRANRYVVYDKNA